MERRRRVGALLIAMLSIALATPAWAGDVTVQSKAVLELFTSQGCSSCPAADALFGELSERDDLVTLAYHVDYWDYIGWADTFGAAANSDLQRDYAEGWGSARIYTPQLIVNGERGVVASRRDEVDAAIGVSALELPVTLETGDGMLGVSIAGKAGLPDAIVWLVTFRDHAVVPIERGENEGKSITYSQIVTGRQVLAMWEASGGAHFKLPLDEVITGESNGAAIVVQEERNGLPGRILGAAKFQL